MSEKLIIIIILQIKSKDEIIKFNIKKWITK